MYRIYNSCQYLVLHKCNLLKRFERTQMFLKNYVEIVKTIGTEWKTVT